jgi:hypothetical protein
MPIFFFFHIPVLGVGPFALLRDNDDIVCHRLPLKYVNTRTFERGYI